MFGQMGNSGFRRRRNAALLPLALSRRFDRSDLVVENAGRVAIYPRLGLAFNRIRKNANSTTVTVLHRLEAGVYLSDHAAKRSSASLSRATVRQLASAPKLHYFVIVRNPYSRVLSAFLNKFAKPEYIERHGGFSLDTDGFGRFLEWLEHEDAITLDGHWNLQTTALFAPVERFDTCLRYEDFPNSFFDLLERRGIGLPPDVLDSAKEVNSQTRTHASARLADFYREASIERVARLYREDFSSLNYSIDFAEA